MSIRIQDPSGTELPLEDLYLEATPAGDDTFILISTLPIKDVTSELRWRPLRWRKNSMELEAVAEVRNERTGPLESLLRVEVPEGTEIRSSNLPATQSMPGAFDFRLTVPARSTRTLRFTARVPKSGLPFSY